MLFGSQCRASWSSAGLHPCGASAEPCRALKYVHLFSINKYRDIRLIALLRILSCFLDALLSQVQVCILVAHQQSCRALNLHIVLDKQIRRDICLIALLRILSCVLEASAALLSQVQVSAAEPCRALNVSILFLINNYFAQGSELFFGSAALVVKCRFALWRISRAPPSLKYVLLFLIDKYRGIRLIALFRILSCFWDALLSQVQVCILVAHQQSCRALNLHIVLDKQIRRDICLIALLRILSCVLEASAALLSQVQVSAAEPCRALNVSILFLINNYFAQDSELFFWKRRACCQVQVCTLAHQQSPAEL